MDRFTFCILGIIFCVASLFVLLCVYLDVKIGKSLGEECCDANHGQVVFYECQCSLFQDCSGSGIKCGDYCQLDNKEIKLEDYECNLPYLS